MRVYTYLIHSTRYTHIRSRKLYSHVRKTYRYTVHGMQGAGNYKVRFFAINGTECSRELC